MAKLEKVISYSVTTVVQDIAFMKIIKKVLFYAIWF